MIDSRPLQNGDFVMCNLPDQPRVLCVYGSGRILAERSETGWRPPIDPEARVTTWPSPPDIWHPQAADFYNVRFCWRTEDAEFDPATPYARWLSKIDADGALDKVEKAHLWRPG